MARAILIIGEPGTGKSRSIKNLDPKETIIIKPNSKELPFRGAAKNYVQGKNMFVVRAIRTLRKDKKIVALGIDEVLKQANSIPRIKNVIIEDLTHYFSKRVIDERTVKGYDKWTELAADLKQCIIDKESELRPDLNMIIIAHVSAVADAAGVASIGIQTPGKLLDNSIKIPSYVTYIFHTFVDTDEAGNTRYRFLTNKDGLREAKTPEEMFPKYIDNDLDFVIKGITQYQIEEGITPVGLTLEAKKEIEEKAAAQIDTEIVQTEQSTEAEAAKPAQEAEETN